MPNFPPSRWDTLKPEERLSYVDKALANPDAGYTPSQIDRMRWVKGQIENQYGVERPDWWNDPNTTDRMRYQFLDQNYQNGAHLNDVQRYSVARERDALLRVHGGRAPNTPNPVHAPLDSEAINQPQTMETHMSGTGTGSGGPGTPPRGRWYTRIGEEISDVWHHTFDTRKSMRQGYRGLLDAHAANPTVVAKPTKGGLFTRRNLLIGAGIAAVAGGVNLADGHGYLGYSTIVPDAGESRGSLNKRLMDRIKANDGVKVLDPVANMTFQIEKGKGDIYSVYALNEDGSKMDVPPLQGGSHSVSLVAADITSGTDGHTLAAYFKDPTSSPNYINTWGKALQQHADAGTPNVARRLPGAPVVGLG